MMNPKPNLIHLSSDELVRESLQAAVLARDLLWKLSTYQIEKEHFLNELSQIPAKEIIFANWENFKNNTALYPSLEIYQVISSLLEEIEYQLQFYGLDSFIEDIKQLDAAIKSLKRYSNTDNVG